jgi:hypothetical protein
MASAEERVERDIREIMRRLYDLEPDDPSDKVQRLTEARNELIRGYLIYLHLALDDLLGDLVAKRLRRASKLRIRDIRTLVEDELKPLDKIEWATRLDLITNTDRMNLIELNKSEEQECSRLGRQRSQACESPGEGRRDEAAETASCPVQGQEPLQQADIPG